MKRLILIAALVVAVAGGTIGYRMYDEKTPTAAETKTDVTIEAPALYAAFMKDRTAAGALYNEKTVQVRGTVRSIESGQPVNVYIDPGTPDGSIVCEFDPAVAPSWAVGKTVSLKGICAGLNGLPGMEDVLLQRCAAVEQILDN